MSTSIANITVDFRVKYCYFLGTLAFPYCISCWVDTIMGTRYSKVGPFLGACHFMCVCLMEVFLCFMSCLRSVGQLYHKEFFVKCVTAEILTVKKC